jgi:hypothetical protein
MEADGRNSATAAFRPRQRTDSKWARVQNLDAPLILRSTLSRAWYFRHALARLSWPNLGTSESPKFLRANGQNLN